MTNPLLSTDLLSVTYGHGRTSVAAVLQVSLHLHRGETVALVGESGSGKTSLVNAMLGLTSRQLAQVSGRAVLDGADLAALSDRGLSQIRGSRVGYIPQDPIAGLNPARRIGGQVGDAVRVHHRALGRAEVTARVADALREVGLSDIERILRAFPHELSGGQRQRVLIATALINRPVLLIADEPTSALDVTTQKAILDRLAELQQEHQLGVLLVTHDLGVAHERADRIYVMHSGLIVSHGTPEQIAHSGEPYTAELVAAAPSINSAPLRPRSRRPRIGTLEPLLEIRGLTKQFGRGASTTLAVDDASLVVRTGSTHALVGESGAGKSTVARIVVGLVGATAGSIALDGVALPTTVRARPLELRRQIGFVHQNPYHSLDPKLRVADVITEPLRNLHRPPPRNQRRERAAELLELVGLTPAQLDRHPGELSGGQRQRVAIARALALRPKLIVLDEAVSALDVIVQARILQLLVDLQAEHGVSLLFITHDLGVVAQVADQVTVMRHGRVRESGPTRQVLDDPQDAYTRFLIDSVPRGVPTRASAPPIAIGQ